MASQGNQRWRKSRAVVGVALLTSALGRAGGSESPPASALEDPDLKIPLWHWAFEVRGAAGYKDNVTLSSQGGAGSGLWLSHADVMLFPLPSRGWRGHFFASVDDVRYFDSPGTDNEQTAMAAAQVSKDFGHGWSSSLGFNYLYQNQFFDMSATYTNGGSIGLVRGHMLSPRWGARKALGAFWLDLELAGTRQMLAAPLDDFWEAGPRLRLGVNYGHGSEIALTGMWTYQDYDTREQADLVGRSLPGSSLAFQTQGAELAWTHNWDSQKRWQTTLRVGGETIRDNGSGYYDYAVYRVQPEVRYRNSSWEFLVRAGVRFFTYDHQTVSASDTSRRERTLLTATVRAERRLSRHLKLHASYHLDRSLSNLDFDDYVANTVMGGLALEF